VGDLVAWRLQKPGYGNSASDLLSGEGAWRAGGRWNSRGRRVVYMSCSVSLATMEMLAQGNNVKILPHYLKLSVNIPEGVILELGESDWPPGWDDPAIHHPGTQQIGDDWIDLAQSAALLVPSVVVPGEWNVLLNPAHADFSRIVAGPVIAYSVDPRIAGKMGK
jgi:RES domain-containing protein